MNQIVYGKNDITKNIKIFEKVIKERKTGEIYSEFFVTKICAEL